MRILNLCTLSLLLITPCLNAQVTVVKDSKPVSRILVEKAVRSITMPPFFYRIL